MTFCVTLLNRVFFCRIELPIRKGSQKCELRGIFVGAKVVRGYNWEWGNQDGEGIVILILLLYLYKVCLRKGLSNTQVNHVDWYSVIFVLIQISSFLFG